MSSNLNFAKWLQFCDDFNLRSSMSNTPILTSVELAEIFLQSINARTIDYLGKLNIEEFWEAIVRCAQVAYRNVDTNMVNKLKELFVNMSHKIDTSISNSVNFTGHRDVSTNGAMIISGMKKFQFALNVLYREDGMPQSYLTRKPKIRLNGRDLLGTLINKQQREKERLQMLENRKREERDMAMMADEYDDDRSASSNSLGLNRHHRNRSMENRFAAMSAVMDVRKNEDIINHQEQFYEPEILKEEVDRRPPPSTPQVPSSRNRNVSGKDRSYRGLLQKKQLRKK
jgi:hypothetical protein